MTNTTPTWQSLMVLDLLRADIAFAMIRAAAALEADAANILGIRFI